MDEKFDWDDEKAAANIRKHGIDFEEAQTVFGDPRAMTRFDDAHSHTEDRFITIGISARGQLMVVVHVDSAKDIRIISARRATPRETRKYVEA